LVSPLMTNGNMSEFIARFPDKNRLQLLRQVAEGLHYLHSTTRMVHGDLKCTNVLISDVECALLADFGLSTFVDASESATATDIRMRNTVAYAAPELFTDEAFNDAAVTTDLRPRSKTTFSDSFAFGSLVYEVI
ncbi:kinase-like protein, partial [Auricularia subglabra TFB-10046 SS5]